MKKFFGLLAATVAAGTLTCFAGSAQAITILNGTVIEGEFQNLPDDFGDNLGTATDISTGFFDDDTTGISSVVVQGALVNDADFVKFTPQIAGPFTFTITSISGTPLSVNPVIGLYDFGGNLVASAEANPGTGTASFQTTVSNAGNDFFFVGIGTSIDPATGVVSGGSSPTFRYSLDIAKQAVPEPTTMLGLGVAGALGFVAKRKRKQETAV